MTNFLPLLLLTPTLLLLVLGLVWFVVRYQRGQLRQQQELAQMQETAQQQALAAALVAQEDERQRIAAKLHDGVGTSCATPKPRSTACLTRWMRKTMPASMTTCPAGPAGPGKCFFGATIRVTTV